MLAVGGAIRGSIGNGMRCIGVPSFPAAWIARTSLASAPTSSENGGHCKSGDVQVCHKTVVVVPNDALFMQCSGVPGFARAAFASLRNFCANAASTEKGLSPLPWLLSIACPSDHTLTTYAFVFVECDTLTAPPSSPLAAIAIPGSSSIASV